MTEHELPTSRRRGIGSRGPGGTATAPTSSSSSRTATGIGPLPLSARLSMVRSGTVERLRSGGIVGSSVDPDTRVRGASLLVLCAWGVFIVAGSAFAKYTEHWPLATPQVDHWLPATAMAAVQAAAAVGVLIVIMAGLACLPALVEFIRSEGWHALWPLARPMLLSGIAAGVASAGIVAWNNQLGPNTTTPLGLRDRRRARRAGGHRLHWP